MNIQDLQTIVQDKINVKIIIVNNNGYLAIRHTQKEFLKASILAPIQNINLLCLTTKKLVKLLILNI